MRKRIDKIENRMLAHLQAYVEDRSNALNEYWDDETMSEAIERIQQIHRVLNHLDIISDHADDMGIDTVQPIINVTLDRVEKTLNGTYVSWATIEEITAQLAAIWE